MLSRSPCLFFVVDIAHVYAKWIGIFRYGNMGSTKEPGGFLRGEAARFFHEKSERHGPWGALVEIKG